MDFQLLGGGEEEEEEEGLRENGRLVEIAETNTEQHH